MASLGCFCQMLRKNGFCGADAGGIGWLLGGHEAESNGFHNEGDATMSPAASSMESTSKVPFSLLVPLCAPPCVIIPASAMNSY